jgi:hypothetical protein
LLTNRAFLVDFARQVIAGQARQKDTSVLIDAVETPDTPWTASPVGARQSTASTVGTASSSGSASIPNAAFWQEYDQKHSPTSASKGR